MAITEQDINDEVHKLGKDSAQWGEFVGIGISAVVALGLIFIFSPYSDPLLKTLFFGGMTTCGWLGGKITGNFLGQLFGS